MDLCAGPAVQAREVLTRALADAKEAAHSVCPSPQTLIIAWTHLTLAEDTALNSGNTSHQQYERPEKGFSA